MFTNHLKWFRRNIDVSICKQANVAPILNNILLLNLIMIKRGGGRGSGSPGNSTQISQPQVNRNPPAANTRSSHNDHPSTEPTTTLASPRCLPPPCWSWPVTWPQNQLLFCSVAEGLLLFLWDSIECCRSVVSPQYIKYVSSKTPPPSTKTNKNIKDFQKWKAVKIHIQK